MQKKIKISFLIVFFLLANVCGAQDMALARTYFDLGRKLYLRQDYAAAISNFTFAIKNNTKYEEAYQYRSYAHNKLNDFKKQIEDLSSVIRYYPTASNFYARSIAYIDNKQLNKALIDIDQAISREKKTLYINLRAGIHKDMGNTDKAIEDLKFSFATNSNEYAAADLADIYFIKKDYSTALKYINDAINNTENTTSIFSLFDSKKERFYYIRGKIYLNTGRIAEAVQDFTGYIDTVAMKDKDAYFYRAYAFCLLGNANAAKADEESYVKWGGKIDKPCAAKSATAPKEKTVSNLLHDNGIKTNNGYAKYILTGTGLSIKAPQAFKMITDEPDPFLIEQQAFVMWACSLGSLDATVIYSKYSNNKSPREDLEQRKKTFNVDFKNAESSISGTKIMGHPALWFKGSYTDNKTGIKMISEEITYGEFGEIRSISVKYPADDKALREDVSILFGSAKEDGSTIKSRSNIPVAYWTKFEFNGLLYYSPIKQEGSDCDKGFKTSVQYTSVNACYNWATDFDLRVGYRAYKNARDMPYNTRVAAEERKKEETEFDELTGDVVQNTYSFENMNITGADNAYKLKQESWTAGLQMVHEIIFIKQGLKFWTVELTYFPRWDYIKEARNKVVGSLALKK